MPLDESVSPLNDQTVVMVAYEQTLFGWPAAQPTGQISDHPMAAECSPAEEALARCRTFGNVSPEVRKAVADALVEVSLGAGEPLIEQGVPGRGLWILAAGRVEVHVHDDHQQTIFINAVGPGEVLGEMSLLTHQPATASVIAERPTVAYLLDAATFHRLASEHAELCVVLTNLVATRLGGSQIDVLAGKTLDRYRIQRRLGRGGMSIVYDAVCLDDGQRVALKMMSHRLVYDELACEMFHREADLIAGFDHPNIVRLVGRFEAFHTHFIAMEFCDGEDLRSLLHRCGPVPADQVRPIAGQLAQALRYSHDAGVIHRDVKPSNVILRDDGRVMLMDFGLAKPRFETGATPKMAMGTPRYMPVEQLHGGSLDRTADYFSFGCVVFELLLHEPLITAESPHQLVELHESWSLPRILERCRDVDRDLQAVLAGCLSSKADERSLDFSLLDHWATLPVTLQDRLPHHRGDAASVVPESPLSR